MNKHIELFKQIPWGNFGPSKLFFDNFKKKAMEDITIDDIFLAYYYISTEMMDDEDSRFFIVRKNKPPFNKYDCHDPLTNEHIPVQDFKEAKVYNGIIKKHQNRVPHSKYYGLTATPKNQNDDLHEIIQDFKFFAKDYKDKHFCRDIFTNEPRYCMGDEEMYNLYILLKTLCDKATFKYKQPGSIILAQELASVMANQNIVKNNQYTYASNGVEFVHRHKMFMFGELQKQY